MLAGVARKRARQGTSASGRSTLGRLIIYVRGELVLRKDGDLLVQDRSQSVALLLLISLLVEPDHMPLFFVLVAGREQHLIRILVHLEFAERALHGPHRY